MVDINWEYLTSTDPQGIYVYRVPLHDGWVYRIDQPTEDGKYRTSLVFVPDINPKAVPSEPVKKSNLDKWYEKMIFIAVFLFGVYIGMVLLRL
jgi:hypothetical protein